MYVKNLPAGHYGYYRLWEVRNVIHHFDAPFSKIIIIIIIVIDYQSWNE